MKKTLERELRVLVVYPTGTGGQENRNHFMSFILWEFNSRSRLQSFWHEQKNKRQERRRLKGYKGRSRFSEIRSC